MPRWQFFANMPMTLINIRWLGHPVKPVQAVFRIQPRMNKLEVREYLSKIYGRRARAGSRRGFASTGPVAEAAAPRLRAESSAGSRRRRGDAAAASSPRGVGTSPPRPGRGFAPTNRRRRLPVKKVMTDNWLGRHKRIQGKRQMFRFTRPAYKRAIVTFDRDATVYSPRGEDDG